MFSRRLKTGYLVLEGLNSFAVVYYFYYLYFFMQKEHGFGNKDNLTLAALNGATYALFAWFGGRFGQRFGYFRALKVGFLVMAAALAVGSQLKSTAGHITVMVVTVFGMSFTWPTLEALVSEGESRAGLQHMLGLYNVVWAATASIASFTGGVMLDQLGLPSLFYVPIGFLTLQVVLTFWLEARARAAGQRRIERPAGASLQDPDSSNEASRPTAAASGSAALSLPSDHAIHPRAKTFQRLAWLANPFAYIALNTTIAIIPGVAARLNLSTTAAGFFCSVWCFARFGAFWTLWLWDGWHYRFRWLLVAYVVLVSTFAAISMVPNLAVIVTAQVLFGAAIGLMYYSSLFYSMDASETKGDHGGIHESAIGLGNLAGPAIGAAALQFLPQFPHSGMVAVSLLLLGGLFGLTAIWRAGGTS